MELPLALIVAATAVKTIGTLQQADAASQAARFNAKMAGQQAKVASDQAAAQEEAKRRQTARFLGSQRAAFAQSGGGMGGSAADVMQQSAAEAELDALTIRYEGDLRAQGFQAEAAQQRFAARSAKKAGYYKAGGTILAGAADYGAAGGFS